MSNPDHSPNLDPAPSEREPEPPQIRIDARPSPRLRMRELKAASCELDRDPRGSRPFALSHNVTLRGEEVVRIPTVSAWHEEAGAICRTGLIRSNYPLAARLALPAHHFLAMNPAFKEIVENQTRVGCLSEQSYRFTVTPHGLLLIAYSWVTPFDEGGSPAVASALVPQGLSTHQRLAAEVGLARAIRDIIRHENAITGAHPDPDVTVRIA